jgi:hypothetical protein
MKPGRVVALIVGCLLLLPGLGLLLGGGGLGLAYAIGRHDGGYFQERLTSLETPTVAVAAEDLELRVDAGSPGWLLDALDPKVRLRVAAADAARPIFLGIGPAADVAAYLDGAAHDEVIGLTDDQFLGFGDGGTPVYRTSPGDLDVADPAEQSFWAATVTGPGAQELTWQPTNGRWAVVVMNADGAPGLDAAATVGVRAGFVLPLALILFGPGVLNTAGAIALIVFAASGRRTHRVGGQVFLAGAPAGRPVMLTAHLDPALSRWQWLVKWFLAIPHFLVLAFLWPAFLVVTVIAGASILVTGSYPRALFAFTTGVLRWSWRVSYYATSGGIGTDAYPPFTLGPAPDYPATLDITYPATLSRGLVLVKWWLLALPHYVIVALLIGWWGAGAGDGEGVGLYPVGGGVLGLLVLVAGVILAVTGRYPPALFDVIVGLNRWIYRVIAYAALMTDTYPPFRLDQGGSEPSPPLPAPRSPDEAQGDHAPQPVPSGSRP